MRAPRRTNLFETFRAAISVAGAVETRSRPDTADLKMLGIDETFAENRYFRRPAR